MTKIKIGDRVRLKHIGAEVTVVALPAGGWFQSVKNGPFINLEDVERVRTKLIPFQADKWTPEMQVVTRKELKHVRILCVDADNEHYPVVGLIENRVRETWTINGGIDSDTLEYDNDLMVLVETKTKTKTLYGYWNDTRKQDYAYESESTRDLRFEEYSNQDTDIRIKFQTEIEL